MDLIYQCFHPVGHGTFLTGILNQNQQTTFSWVYDCGSNRREKIEEQVSLVNQSPLWPDTIDMVVLSHFDDDHVNGLDIQVPHHGSKHSRKEGNADAIIHQLKKVNEGK